MYKFKDFFEQNKDLLSNLHPGLNLKILNQAFQEAQIDEDAFLATVLKGVPLAYIVGKRFFYKHEFRVNPDVLIPRFETEILVEKAIEYIKKNHTTPFLIADVGCGSGNIGLSIVANTDLALNLYMIDISEKALCVAKENHQKLKDQYIKKSSVNFFQSDLFDQFPVQDLNLIVANPPYISTKDKNLVHSQVDLYEPSLALYIDENNYFSFFERFFKSALLKLKVGGALFMEGHENTLKNLAPLANSLGFSDSRLINDYCGKERFLYCLKKEA